MSVVTLQLRVSVSFILLFCTFSTISGAGQEGDELIEVWTPTPTAETATTTTSALPEELTLALHKKNKKRTSQSAADGKEGEEVAKLHFKLLPPSPGRRVGNPAKRYYLASMLHQSGTHTETAAAVTVKHFKGSQQFRGIIDGLAIHQNRELAKQLGIAVDNEVKVRNVLIGSDKRQSKCQVVEFNPPQLTPNWSKSAKVQVQVDKENDEFFYEQLSLTITKVGSGGELSHFFGKLLRKRNA